VNNKQDYNQEKIEAIRVLETPEYRQLTDQLHQAQKMELVGCLAGGVVHDLNNLLTAIIGYAELCRDAIEPNHPIRTWFDEIILTANEAVAITRLLLTFARKQVVDARVFDLNGLVPSILGLLRRLVGENITLVWNPSSAFRPVRMAPAQVTQILVNLCINARDAIAGVGEIRIESESIAVSATDHLQFPELPLGQYTLLAVSDNGCGIDRETITHVYEPFFTTKIAGQGTGLGLASVYGIVQQSNGFIHIDSEPGKGTTFKIYLPQAEKMLLSRLV